MLEFNKVYYMDCIDGMKVIPDANIDLVITDPPYGIDYQSNYRTIRFDKVEGDTDSNMKMGKLAVKEIYRVLKNNTAFYCFTRWDVYPRWYNEISKYFKIKNCLIIKRKHTSMGDLFGAFAPEYEMCIFAMKGRRLYNKIKCKPIKRFDVKKKNKSGFSYRYSDLITSVDVNEGSSNVKHPTQKSIDIIELFIRLHSNKNDIILDPFIGSGTTAIASLKLNRKFIGFEISEKYYKIANERIREYVNQTRINNF